MNEETALAWAAKAVRTKGGHRVLDWIPGPATEPGATALYGSGIPR
ncbi:hypothetical protein ACIBSV_42135 [Embleya sp. NPDC050154]